MKNPIFVALDVPTWDEARSLVEKIGDLVGGFKVGPRLSLKARREDWKFLGDQAPVFFDPKFYDIPNTMCESLKACADLGISYVTIHALSGSRAMEAVARTEQTLRSSQDFKVLTVTVLTSFEGDHSMPGFKGQPLKQVVLNLTQDIVSAGLTGVVCSGAEVEDITKKFQGLFSVVPGVRQPEEEVYDQSRVITPQKALSLGAQALVVGRPIIHSSDPVNKLQEYIKACSYRGGGLAK